LRRFLADRPIRSRRTSTLERAWRLCRRNPLVASLSAAILFLLVVSTAGALIQSAVLSKALDAERVKLWESLRDRARALRMSRRPGQRIESLRSIAEALRLEVPPGHSLAELRTEAAAALALPDLEFVREWSGGLTQGVLAIAFDDNLSQCARLNEDGTVTVCRVGDETVVARWKVAGARILSGTERPAKFSRDGRYLAVWYGHPGFLEVRRLDGQE